MLRSRSRSKWLLNSSLCPSWDTRFSFPTQQQRVGLLGPALFFVYAHIHQSLFPMADWRDVRVRFLVTHESITLGDFEIVERRTRNGINVTERYELSYSELVGNPSLNSVQAESLIQQLAKHIQSPGPRQSYRRSLRTCYDRAQSAIAPASRGDCSRLVDLMQESSAFSEGDIDRICRWPKSRMLDRLKQYLLRSNSTVV